MDRQAEPAAFAKACAYLNYKQVAKWTAHAAAAGTGIVYVALLVVLWLFTDLLVYRGRLPTSHSLTPLQQNHFYNEWNNLDPEERYQRLRQAGISEEMKTRGITDDKLHKLADQDDIQTLSRDDQRVLWRAQVGYTLVSQLRLDPAEDANLVDYNVDLGITSLLVRLHAEGRIITPVVAAMARAAPWTRNPNGGRGVSPYLTGLLLAGILLGVLGVVLMLLMREMAARATIEAATRCAAPFITTPSGWVRWPSERWGRPRPSVSSPDTSRRSTTPCSHA